jgi:hypothetical protein
MSAFVKKVELKLLSLIVDVVGDHSDANKAALQDRLEQAVSASNEELSSDLASAFVVNVGDQIQGVLVSPRNAVAAIFYLEEALPTLPLRFGIGWGSFSTPLLPRSGSLAGLCLFNSGLALERGAREHRWVTAQGFGEDEDTTLNAMFRLLQAVRSHWTPKQKLTVAMVRKAQTQRDVAKRLGVYPSVVSEALKAARYEVVVEAEAALITALRRFAMNPE